MKKKFLSIFLALCCAGGSMTVAGAVESIPASNPDLVVPYNELEDPMSFRASLKQQENASVSKNPDTFERIFGADNAYRYSGFMGKNYVVPSGFSIYDGIDVSKWDQTINWSAVKNDGVDFAIIRVGNRSVSASGALMEDPYYKQNITGALAAGIPVGVYIFSQALTTNEAIAEANFLLSRIQGFDIQLPVVMDYEFYNGSGRLDTAKLSRRQMTDNALAFCQVIRAAGYTPMLYANKSFLTSNVYASEISAVAPIWLANYTQNTTYANAFDYWQYTETGRVNGINTYVDCNFLFKNGALIPEKTDSSLAPFVDVSLSEWYADSVDFVYQHRLMTGIEENLFSPDATLTRAQVTQILYNLCGKPEVSYTPLFSDVNEIKTIYDDRWYVPAVTWAGLQHVINGYEDGTFHPNESVTREQFVTILYNFTQSYHLDMDQLGDFSSFLDSNMVSDYAALPMQWAVGNKLVMGMNSLTLAPQDIVPRKQCAQILNNFFTGTGASLLELFKPQNPDETDKTEEENGSADESELPKEEQSSEEETQLPEEEQSSDDTVQTPDDTWTAD